MAGMIRQYRLPKVGFYQKHIKTASNYNLTIRVFPSVEHPLLLESQTKLTFSLENRLEMAFWSQLIKRSE